MNCCKLFALVSVLLVLSLSACGPEIVKLTVDVSGPDTLEVGKQSAFTAVLKDSDNKVIGGKTFIWSSSDPSKATVIPSTGEVTALKAGTVTISAATEGQTGKASLKVFDIEVAVSGPTLLELGKTAAFSATVKDTLGNTLTGKTVTWASSDLLIASVDASGIATAKGISSFSVSATVEGREGKSASVKTFGLEARGGTYNEFGKATLGTVIVRKLRDATGAVVTTDSTGSISGPAGWNNNLPLNLKYEANRSSSSELLDTVAVLSGAYQASVTLGASNLNTSFNIDAAQKLEPPALTTGTLSTISVPVSWGAVAGAKSYTVNLRQSTSSTTIASASFDNTVTSHTFSGTGLGLVSGTTYKLEVRASTRNPDSGDPLPAQVNVSARMINIVIP